jgi:hypothetical protein
MAQENCQLTELPRKLFIAGREFEARDDGGRKMAEGVKAEGSLRRGRRGYYIVKERNNECQSMGNGWKINGELMRCFHGLQR